MPTLGEELRRRREERGATLAQIAEATRIGTRFLKAIESDNFSVLPGGIYTRNFIRAFASHVGMKEEEAIALYHQQVGAQNADQAAQQHEQRSRLEKLPEMAILRGETLAVRRGASRGSWPAIVAVTGAGLIVLIIVISLVQRLSRGEGETEIQASSSPPAQETAEAPTAPAPPDTLGVGEPLKIRLEATDGPCSIQYWLDDETKSSNLFLQPGQSQELPPARNQVRLNIGNRTTLKMRINDRDASFPPELQKFRAKVTIARDNLQTFFQ
jgi:transcriptional regulator with XRE-family HTH domain